MTLPVVLDQGQLYPGPTPGVSGPVARLYGRIVTIDGRPLAGAQLTLTLTQQASLPPSPAALALVAGTATITTGPDGSFSLPFTYGYQPAPPPGALATFVLALTGPGVALVVSPVYGAGAIALTGLPYVVPPSWTPLTTLTVTGVVGVPSGGPALAGAGALTVALNAPQPCFLADGTLVSTLPITVPTNPDGSFAQPLLARAQLPPGTTYTVSYPLGGSNRIAPPTPTLTTLAALILS